MVAISGSELAQLPPLEGEIDVVSPIQSSASPRSPIEGPGLMVTTSDSDEIHPVAMSVKVNVTCPSDTAMTSPLF